MLLIGFDTAVAARARYHAEVDEVHVDRVCPATAAVLKLPYLHSTAGNFGQDTVGDILKANAVDEPLAVLMVELEVMVDAIRLRWERNITKRGGDSGGIVNRGRANVEAHDFVRVLKVNVHPKATDIREVTEFDLLAGEWRKVENHLVALGDGDELRSG
jgi:hypothetical protein